MANRNVLALNATNPAIDTVSPAIDTMGGSYIVLYLKSPAGTTAGTVQLEGSPTGSLGAAPSNADWVAVGAALAFGVANTTVKVAVTESHRYVRAHVTVAFVGGGVMTVYITIGGPMTGEWREN